MTRTTHAAELSRSECLALLPTARFGRLVHTEGALPAVLPVSFVVDPVGIVIRTATRSGAVRAADSTIVAFQADDIDVEHRAGWSVTVVGVARVVRDPVEAARLARLPLQPWVAGARDAFVVVEIGMVSGRRIGGPEPVLGHAWDGGLRESG